MVRTILIEIRTLLAAAGIELAIGWYAAVWTVIVVGVTTLFVNSRMYARDGEQLPVYIQQRLNDCYARLDLQKGEIERNSE